MSQKPDLVCCGTYFSEIDLTKKKISNTCGIPLILISFSFFILSIFIIFFGTILSIFSFKYLYQPQDEPKEILYGKIVTGFLTIIMIVMFGLISGYGYFFIVSIVGSCIGWKGIEKNNMCPYTGDIVEKKCSKCGIGVNGWSYFEGRETMFFGKGKGDGQIQYCGGLVNRGVIQYNTCPCCTFWSSLIKIDYYKDALNVMIMGGLMMIMVVWVIVMIITMIVNGKNKSGERMFLGILSIHVSIWVVWIIIQNLQVIIHLIALHCCCFNFFKNNNKKREDAREEFRALTGKDESEEEGEETNENNEVITSPDPDIDPENEEVTEEKDDTETTEDVKEENVGKEEEKEEVVEKEEVEENKEVESEENSGNQE